MTEQQEIAVDMAVRDLMGATTALCELPERLVRFEFEDIELAHKQLGKLLENIKQNDAEAAWERHCEDFHDGSSTLFKSLQQQQIEAMKLK